MIGNGTELNELLYSFSEGLITKYGTVDVTFKDAENYDYFGIELPFTQIFQIGKMNGDIWYCALPYLKK